MDATAPTKPVKINRWLPYWAVFQNDVWQTVRSWAYRVWVLTAMLAGLGCLLYYAGMHNGAGIQQLGSELVSKLLRWIVLGSITLVIVLTAGCISSERGTMADSVLSRGISRFQYFFGKWHSRLVTILATFMLMGVLAMTGSYFLLHMDLDLLGSAIALLTVTAMLGAVISCGVTASAVTNSTVMGIAVLWILLYGGGFALNWLPADYPSPDRVLKNLQYIIQGQYDLQDLGRLIGFSALLSGVAALFGMLVFSRRDV
jgi:ABC-2 type transport system permease protein